MAMRKAKIGVVVFPGSNCDHDALYVAGDLLAQETRVIWHKEGSLGDVDAVILPGGFSYGDYLRCGAIARFSPVMKDVVRYANAGGRVIGICNGFQVLTEAGLLPGVLLRNESLRFICRDVHLRVENPTTMFTSMNTSGEILRIPIAHGDGNYFTDADTLRRLEDKQQIIFRYCDERGNVTPASNPNGSLSNIAGIINEKGNVLGMMPHPERAADAAINRENGRPVFESMIRDILSSEYIA
jgi:phosphoribosylformylglycinamidine synthase I